MVICFFSIKSPIVLSVPRHDNFLVYAFMANMHTFLRKLSTLDYMTIRACQYYYKYQLDLVTPTFALLVPQCIFVLYDAG